MAFSARVRLDRVVEDLRDRHPEVILHLRDFLLLDDEASGRSTLIAFAKVPTRRPGVRLVITAGTRPADHNVPDRIVHVAAFRYRHGTQCRTPVTVAHAWARAIVGDLWAPYLRRTGTDPRWPGSAQLRYPAEQFVVGHPGGVTRTTST